MFLFFCSLLQIDLDVNYLETVLIRIKTIKRNLQEPFLNLIIYYYYKIIYRTKNFRAHQIAYILEDHIRKYILKYPWHLRKGEVCGY